MLQEHNKRTMKLVYQRKLLRHSFHWYPCERNRSSSDSSPRPSEWSESYSSPPPTGDSTHRDETHEKTQYGTINKKQNTLFIQIWVCRGLLAGVAKKVNFRSFIGRTNKYVYMSIFRYTPFECLGTVRFFMFLSLLCSPRLHLFDQKYSKNSNIVKYYYHLK